MDPIPAPVKAAFDWKFILKILVVIALINLVWGLLDMFWPTGGAYFGAVYNDPVAFAKNGFKPTATNSTS